MNKRVLWTRVWGIAAVQGSITLCWVIYNLYLPVLLVNFGFDKDLAIALLIIENALEAAIEPIFGSLSDRQLQSSSYKISVISLGIVSSSILFLAIGSLIFFNPNSLVRWFLPILAVIWASAMAIFRAPVMALLGRCAAPSHLPRAASILTLVGGLVGALRFDAYGLILQKGAGFAFALGSFTLIVAGLILHKLNPNTAQDSVENRQRILPLRMVLLFATGIGVGWGLRFLIPTVNQILTIQVGQENSKMALTLFFIVLGTLALPAGKIGTQIGNSLGMIFGCSLVILAITIAAFIPISTIKYAAIALLILGFSLVLNGAIPYAISFSSSGNFGLGVGMYFGGLNAGISSFGFVFYRLGQANITVGTIGTILSFSLVLACLLSSKKLLRKQNYSLRRSPRS